MSRDVPYDPDEVCEVCGVEGCFMLPYMNVCPRCLEEDNDEEKHRSAH